MKTSQGFVIVWLFVISISFGGLFSESWAGETKSTKEDIIQAILADFQLIYFLDEEERGKTLTVVIKDFSGDDEETYAIDHKNKRFWVIYLSLVRG